MCRAELLPQIQLPYSEASSGLSGDENMVIRRPNERSVELLPGDRDVGSLLRPPGMTMEEAYSSPPLRSPYRSQDGSYPLLRGPLGVRMVDGRRVNYFSRRPMVVDIPVRRPDADQSPGTS